MVDLLGMVEMVSLLVWHGGNGRQLNMDMADNVNMMDRIDLVDSIDMVNMPKTFGYFKLLVDTS